MILPNKFIDLDSSILSKMLVVLDVDLSAPININNLYIMLESKFDSIDEFIYSIDILYLLNYVEVDFEKKEIWNVKRN